MRVAQWIGMSAIAFALATSDRGEAAVVMFDFEASISQVYDHNGILASKGIYVGDIVRGSMAYDTSVPVLPNSSSHGIYRQSVTNFTLSAGGVGEIGRFLNLNSNLNYISIFNNHTRFGSTPPFDQMLFGQTLSSAVFSQWPYVSGSFSLGDSTAAAFGTTGLPVDLDLATFDTRLVSFGNGALGLPVSESFQFDANIFSLTKVEPAAGPVLPPNMPNAPSPVSLGGDVGNFDPSKPTVVITHGWQPGGQVGDPLWVSDMAQMIGSAVSDPTAVNILEAYWDDAKTAGYTPQELRAATAQVGQQGRFLANTLDGLPGAFEGGIQFIGHSLGSLVNAYAASALTGLGMNVDQFTILDRPFGSGLPVDSIIPLGGDVDADIFRALLPKDRVIWVDNYYGNDFFYSDDILKPNPSSGAPFSSNVTALNVLYDGASHSEVHERYADTIGQSGGCGSAGGFACSIARASQLRIDSEKWDPGVVRFGPAGNLIDVNALSWLTFNCQKNVIGQNVDCYEGSPAHLWNEDFMFDPRAEFLTFDFIWTAPGDGDWMTVFFNDTLLFNSPAIWSSDIYESSGLIPVHDLAGQTGQLLFSLNSVGASNAAFSISNVAVLSSAGAVPEPAVWIMMILGFAFVGQSIRSVKEQRSKLTDRGVQLYRLSA